MKIFRDVTNLADLKPGDILRHKGTGRGYIVTGQYGSYAMAVKQMHICNASEWQVKAEDARTIYEDLRYQLLVKEEALKLANEEVLAVAAESGLQNAIDTLMAQHEVEVSSLKQQLAEAQADRDHERHYYPDSPADGVDDKVGGYPEV